MYEFVFAGKPIRESAKTASKTVAKEAEKSRRRELERTLADFPAAKHEQRIRSVSDMVAVYLDAYGLHSSNQDVLSPSSRV